MSIIDGFKNISKSKWFDNFITIVILLAGLVVGLQTSHDMRSSYGNWLNLFDNIILAIFVVEIIIHTLAEGKRPWRYFYDSWHIFDFIIVALCFIPLFFPNSDTQFFAVFRLARILRLARIFEKIKNLKVLLLALVKGLPKMTYVILLLALLFYIYGVIGTDVFGEEEVESFGTIWLSMKTLFFVMFEGWSWIYELEGIERMIDNGFPDIILVIYFVSFLFASAMIFLNLFIGIITSDMESVKADEKRGKSKFYKKDHTVILGWSMGIYKIIEELIEANDSRERAYIVILADREKEEMEFDINDNIKKKNTTKIICRSGIPSDISNLKMLNAWNSRSIILLGDSTQDDSDLIALKSIIALMNHSDDDNANDFRILAEMQNPKFIKIAKSISKDRAIFFESKDFIARLISQTCLQAHLSEVYAEITGFQGSELYIENAPKELIGKSYREMLFSYDVSCPIGIYSKDLMPVINPLPDYKIKSDDRLIILAEDDSTIKLTNNKYSIASDKIISVESEKLSSRNLLILGSNSKLPIILKEINDYLQVKSKVKIVSSDENCADECFEYLSRVDNEINIGLERVSMNHISMSNLDISFVLGDIEDIDTLEREVEAVDQVTLLSYYEAMNDIQQADAITLVALIHLRNLSKAKKYKFPITTEIIDESNHELIDNPDVCDFIISAQITSSILAQLSEEKELKKVFQVLFQADGSEIYLRKATSYCKLGATINFATIIESAICKNETAIGYMIDGKAKLFKVNPTKNSIFTISEGDKVIVLAED